MTQDLLVARAVTVCLPRQFIFSQSAVLHWYSGNSRLHSVK